MSFSAFAYRLQQKWKYHTAGDSFEKRVAEINRNQPVIFVSAQTFQVKGYDLVLSRGHHAFVLERFQLFEELIKAGTFKVDSHHLLYTIGSTVLRITTAEEIFIVHEVYVERCYNVVTPWKFNVIDIGMNVGFASLYFAGNSNVTTIQGYEPFGPTFNDAQFNFSLNPILAKKITGNNFGFGLTDEKRGVKFSAITKGKNSVQPANTGNAAIVLKNAKTVLDDIIGKTEGEHFFIKMDCEGGEFEIFESLRVNLIRQEIFGFIIEWHFKNPQPIVEILLANDFKVRLSGNTEIGMITAFR